MKIIQIFTNLFRKHTLRKKIKVLLRYQFSIYYSLQGKGSDELTLNRMNWVDERKRMREWIDETNF
jgi:hypothetical protein